MSRKGFTLVEIMIVVAIIGLLAAIAVPSFLKARESARRTACINNMRQVEAGKDQYALEYGGEGSFVMNHSDVAIYLKDTNKVFCPLFLKASRYFSSNYSVNAISNPPTCKNSVGAEQNHDLLYSGA